MTVASRVHSCLALVLIAPPSSLGRHTHALEHAQLALDLTLRQDAEVNGPVVALHSISQKVVGD
jgi:hypothetical protein